MASEYLTQITITRRTRSLGYGVTSHVARDGSSIRRPGCQTTNLTPRTLLAARPGMVRSVGGNPAGGADGVWYREAVFVGGKRVIFGEDADMDDLLCDLRGLRDGDVNEITVRVERDI